MNEKRFRFTKAVVDGLSIPTKDDVGTVGYAMVWDTQVTGFGLQLRPSGMKTFILVYRNKAGRVRRLTIGRYGRVTVDQARETARHHNGVIALGGDPVADRKRDRTAKTLDEVFERYIADHLRPNRRIKQYEAPRGYAVSFRRAWAKNWSSTSNHQTCVLL